MRTLNMIRLYILLYKLCTAFGAIGHLSDSGSGESVIIGLGGRTRRRGARGDRPGGEQSRRAAQTGGGRAMFV
eukprot:SAG22_NODE_21018_length_260_cov_1.285714_1_plen_72_part_01